MDEYTLTKLCVYCKGFLNICRIHVTNQHIHVSMYAIILVHHKIDNQLSQQIFVRFHI